MPELLAAFAAPAETPDPRADYRWYVGDLRTGKITRQLDLSEQRWSVDIDDNGTLEVTAPLRSVGDDGVTKIWSSSRSDAAPAKAFLACSYVDTNGDEEILAGGPIWTSNYVKRTGKLQIGAAALSSYFDHRKVLPVLTAGQSAAEVSVTYDAAQLGLIAKRLIELAQTHAGGTLPIVLPTDAELGGAGTTHTRTYPGYELGWVGDRLKQLTEIKDFGPEIQFVPRFKTDKRYIEWVMRIGVEPTMVLTQTGPAHVFDMTVPEGPVKDLSVASDGSSMTFRQWAAGQGEAEGRPIAMVEDTTLVDLDWPLLEGEDAGTDTTTTVEQLEGIAGESLLARGRPIETWTLTVDRDARLNVSKYNAGDWATVRIEGDEYLPDGDHSMRIVSLAGGSNASVAIALAPTVGEV